MKPLGLLVVLGLALPARAPIHAQAVNRDDLVGAWVVWRGIQEDQNNRSVLVNGRVVDLYDTLYLGADSTFRISRYNSASGQYRSDSTKRWHSLRSDTIAFKKGGFRYKITLKDQQLTFTPLSEGSALETSELGLFSHYERPSKALPTPGPTATLAELVGTWELIPNLTTTQRDSNEIYATATFRSDGTYLASRVQLVRGDTLSCTHRLIDANEMLARVGSRQGRESITVKDQQLAMREGRGGGTSTEVYKRVDPSKPPFARVIATGFGLGRPVPAHPPTPTGTVADLFGAWRGDAFGYSPGSGQREKNASLLQIIRSDSTVVIIGKKVVGADTLACGRERKEWGKLHRTGDTIMVFRPGQKFLEGKFVFQKKQLSFFDAGTTPLEEDETYRPIELP